MKLLPSASRVNWKHILYCLIFSFEIIGACGSSGPVKECIFLSATRSGSPYSIGTPAARVFRGRIYSAERGVDLADFGLAIVDAGCTLHGNQKRGFILLYSKLPRIMLSPIYFFLFYCRKQSKTFFASFTMLPRSDRSLANMSRGYQW